MTLVADGSNLPPNVAWKLSGRIMIGPGNRPFVETMEVAIEADGFYLHARLGDALSDPGVRKGIAGLVSRLE